MNVELHGFFNMKGVSFVVDMFASVIDVVVYCSHSFKSFFCSGSGEFAVINDVHGVEITVKKTSAWVEFIGSGGCCIAGQLCERYPCFPGVLPVIVVGAQVLL